MSYIGEIPRGYAVCNPSFDDGLTPRPATILTLGSSHLGGGGNATWLEALIPNTTNVAQFSSLWARSTNDFGHGGYAVLGGARTSDGDIFPVSVVGVGGFAICDTSDGPGRAGYFEARRMVVMANTYGVESVIVNFGATRIVTPYNMGGGDGISLALCLSSGHPDASEAQVATCAIGVYNKGAKFSKGIVFADDALNGNDGTTGIGTAISLPKGDAIVWHQPNTDDPVAQIRSDSFDGGSGGASMIFNDNQIFFKNYNGLSTGFEIDVRPGLTKHVITFGGGALNAGITTNNSNLSISSAGGEVHIGGDCTVIGSLTVTDTVTVDGNINTLGIIVTGNTIVTGNSTVNGNLNLGGGLAVGIDVAIDRDLSVTRNIYGAGTFNLTGNFTVNTNAFIGGTLEVDGTVNADGAMDVAGQLDVHGNIVGWGTVGAVGDIFTSAGMIANGDIESVEGALKSENFVVQVMEHGIANVTNGWTLYVDPADFTLKARFWNGTEPSDVVTLATPVFTP